MFLEECARLVESIGCECAENKCVQADENAGVAGVLVRILLTRTRGTTGEDARRGRNSTGTRGR
jgi:hypothetical protein